MPFKAEVVLGASVTRGFGLSNSRGVAAFPNKEAFRLGTAEPYLYVPRVFFRQTIGLSADTVAGEDDALRFVGPPPRERLTLTVGKFSVWDVFDDNRYAHDARTQFLNWVLVGAGGFDFAADARGWTCGAALEWDDGAWGLRAGAFQVARRVNGLSMDPAVTRAWQVIGQVDRFYRLNGRPGAVRLLYGASRTRQSTWGELFANGFETFGRNPSGYRLKHMVALNLEQELTDDLGAFAAVVERRADAELDVHLDGPGRLCRAVAEWAALGEAGGRTRWASPRTSSGSRRGGGATWRRAGSASSPATGGSTTPRNG